MSDTPSLDELFLKASKLRGARRSTFLQSQPPSVRKQLRRLLSADESVNNRGFLDKPLHKAGLPPSKADRNPAAGSSKRASESKKPRLSAQRTSKKARQPDAARRMPARRQVATAAKLPPRRGSIAKSKSQRPQTAVGGKWLTVVLGVLACVFFGGLIVGALEYRQSLSTDPTPNLAETNDTTSLHEVIIPEVAKPKAEVPEPVDLEPNVPPPPTFYSAAVSAPPLSKQQLEALPRALSSLAPVTNPIPLPDVRSWTFETIGYKGDTVPAMTVDGSCVALQSADGNIRIVNLRTNRFERLFTTPRHVWKMEWTGNNQFLLAAWGSDIFKLNRQSGETIPVVTSIKGSWSLTSDRQHLYVIPRAGRKIHVHSVEDFSVVEDIELPSEHASIRLSPDDRLFATVLGNAIDIYENSRPPKKRIQITRAEKLISCAWSDNGLLATGWADGKIRVFDAGSSQSIPIAETLVYAKGYTHVCCWEWLNDDIVLMTGTDQTIDHYSVSEKKIVATFFNRGWTAPLAYSRRLGVGVLCGQEARLLTNGKPARTVLEGEVRLMDSITFNDDGSQLLAAGFHATRFDLNSGSRASLLPEVEGGPWYTTVSVGANDRLLCTLKQHVDAFLTDPPVFSSMVRFDFEPIPVARAVWAEDGTSILACTVDGAIAHCRLATSTKNRLVVPGNEPIKDVVWNNRNQVAVLLGTENLLEWNPATDLVQTLLELPPRCGAKLEINPAGTHLAVVGQKAVILSTKDYKTVLEPDWVRPDAQWVSNNELVGVTQGGRQLHRINLADPAAASTIPIPLVGYRGRASVTFSNTAPVGAAVIGVNQIRFFDTRNGAHLGSIILFGPHDYATSTPDGRIVGSSDGFRKQIVYQIKTDEGQQTLTPEEFFRRFGKHF